MDETLSGNYRILNLTLLPKSSNGRANCVPASAPRVQCSSQLLQLTPAAAAVHVTAVISP